MREERLRLLAELFRRMGGVLLPLTSEEFAGYQHNLALAPFTRGLGIDYRSKCVAYCASVDPIDVVHEMGHVVAHRLAGVDEVLEGEYCFLGWEWAVLQQIQVSLPELQQRYEDYALPADEVTQTRYVGELDPEELSVILQERRQRACALGLLGPAGELLAMDGSTL